MWMGLTSGNLRLKETAKKKPAGAGIRLRGQAPPPSVGIEASPGGATRTEVGATRTPGGCFLQLFSRW